MQLLILCFKVLKVIQIFCKLFEIFIGYNNIRANNKNEGGSNDGYILQIRNRPWDCCSSDFSRHYHLSHITVVPHGVPAFLVIRRYYMAITIHCHYIRGKPYPCDTAQAVDKVNSLKFYIYSQKDFSVLSRILPI